VPLISLYFIELCTGHPILKELKAFEFPKKIVSKIEVDHFPEVFKLKQTLDSRVLLSIFHIFDELGELTMDEMRHMTQDE